MCIRDRVYEEGLPPRFARHQRNSQALRAGLEKLDFSLVPDSKHSLPTLTCVSTPEWVDDKTTRLTLLQDYHIEIGGGLGPLAGKVWRIGLMGESSNFDSVITLLGSIEKIRSTTDQSINLGEGTKAAINEYATMATSEKEKNDF